MSRLIDSGCWRFWCSNSNSSRFNRLNCRSDRCCWWLDWLVYCLGNCWCHSSLDRVGTFLHHSFRLMSNSFISRLFSWLRRFCCFNRNFVGGLRDWVSAFRTSPGQWGTTFRTSWTSWSRTRLLSRFLIEFILSFKALLYRIIRMRRFHKRHRLYTHWGTWIELFLKFRKILILHLLPRISIWIDFFLGFF